MRYSRYESVLSVRLWVEELFIAVSAVLSPFVFQQVDDNVISSVPHADGEASSNSQGFIGVISAPLEGKVIVWLPSLSGPINSLNKTAPLSQSVANKVCVIAVLLLI